ncbi:helix-turn-helix domain-containing protein [Hymenobacter sp. APR13]|uniref:helix-turn-helix domain-containing protein n=1 Tax=Hymenobacter sp. APR13 TaxID=1356852 RepID=UPI0004E07D79|nr:AraC family transcriptional regulator [Hymenobacter sp. APR13]AII54365.1 hypothetical protein N008_20555 [Hymenobacter sp. APR13]
MEYFAVSSLAVGLFLGSLILDKPARSAADWLLAGWFGLLCVHLAAVWVVAFGQPGRWWSVLPLSQALTLLTGAQLWLYARALTEPQFQLRAHLPHLLPVVLALLTVGWMGLVGPGHGVQPLLAVTAGGGLLSVACYAAATLRVVRRAARRPSLAGRLGWLRLAAGSLLGLVLVFGSSQLVRASGLLAVAQFGNWYANLLFCGVVIVMGYGSVRRYVGVDAVAADAVLLAAQPVAGVEEEAAGKEETSSAETTSSVAALLQKPLPVMPASDGASPAIDSVAVKYRRSGQSPPDLEALWQRLREHMAAERPYLWPELSLPQLSQQLGVSVHHVSRVINEWGGQHFYDFVNGYRVAAVRERLRAGAHHRLTLLGVALECGFNSKASFNRAFHKTTGLTPTAYLAGQRVASLEQPVSAPKHDQLAVQTRRSR